MRTLFPEAVVRLGVFDFGLDTFLFSFFGFYAEALAGDSRSDFFSHGSRVVGR